MSNEKDCNCDDRRSMTRLKSLICKLAADGGGGDGCKCLLNKEDGGVVSMSIGVSEDVGVSVLTVVGLLALLLDRENDDVFVEEDGCWDMISVIFWLLWRVCAF